MEDFSHVLKTVMDEKKLTMKAVARIAGTAPGNVSRWLNGHSAPAEAMQDALLKELRSMLDPEKKQKPKAKKLKTVYAVYWIEVEFGQRSMGYKVYSDVDACIKSTKKGSREGPYDGGYIGPERPLAYMEIPYACLTSEMKTALKKTGVCWSDDHWSPEFVGKRVII